MYAVVKTGGKQYRVAAGDILEVEKLDGDVGDSVNLDEVCWSPTATPCRSVNQMSTAPSVTAKITGQHRGKKVQIFRYRPKKRIRVHRGHRQYLTRLEIQSVNL